jgi:hypothetical protein
LVWEYKLSAALERARWYLRSIDERHARLLFPLK